MYAQVIYFAVSKASRLSVFSFVQVILGAGVCDLLYCSAVFNPTDQKCSKVRPLPCQATDFCCWCSSFPKEPCRQSKPIETFIFYNHASPGHA